MVYRARPCLLHCSELGTRSSSIDYVRQYLGRDDLSLSPAEEIFTELNEEPLGVASLAQVHRGVLKDGRVVAVKIQHPDVRKNAYSDMDTIDVCVCVSVSECVTCMDVCVCLCLSE